MNEENIKCDYRFENIGNTGNKEIKIMMDI